jgi:hypothetical protein
MRMLLLAGTVSLSPLCLAGEDISTVNGAIEIGSSSKKGLDLDRQWVSLTAAHVGTTVWGDVDIGKDSRVEGAKASVYSGDRP